MIESKKDLKEYLEADKVSLDISRKKPKLFGDCLWKFEIILRKHEYYLNTGKKIRALYFKYKHTKLGLKLGFSIPCNCFGKGLRLNHYGSVIVNSKAKIGEFCSIFNDVNIGEDYNQNCPTIGNNVWIGPGAKIFGSIYIANNIMIGANSVVNKSFLDENVRIAGVPAKVVSYGKNALSLDLRWKER